MTFLSKSTYKLPIVLWFTISVCEKEKPMRWAKDRYTVGSEREQWQNKGQEGGTLSHRV